MNNRIVKHVTCEYYDPDWSAGSDEFGEPIYGSVDPITEFKLMMLIYSNGAVTLCNLDIPTTIYEKFTSLDDAYKWAEQYAIKHKAYVRFHESEM